ncbi:uncharacterized protein LOC124444029 [Xenia sp. Carnegie-2017]|uniref:uncharacterized protein LOC124444029 n=1 Tax=Xenia sp. Carnegie-2017 TaxID=2897299 RepID=UPI001F04FB22|nr:uncharacterized protein LOC124444029 [Xenia sp. Carnegie-2017]
MATQISFILFALVLSKGYGFQDGYTMEQAQQREPMAVYPNPGEITFKLHEKWDENLLNENTPMFKILEGNVKKAVADVVGGDKEISNIYFRRGFLGIETNQPITVAHLMVNGGSDAAGLLDEAVRPDDSLGDGLKVFKGSFNAY